MKYLLTGASGFLGNYLIRNVAKFNHELITLGRSSSNDIICDLSHKIPKFEKQSIEVVIHAAGKAHCFDKNKKNQLDFELVNVNGTKNILKALDNQLETISHFVFISSVSVYGLNTGIMIDENHPLRGSSDYAKSKIKAEEIVRNWGIKHNVPILILRLPLLIGSNPKGNLKRMIDGIKKKRYFSVGGGRAKKSMVLASDVANFIYSSYNASGVFNLTDGVNHKVRDLEERIGNHFNVKIYNLPVSLIKWVTILHKIHHRFPLSNETLTKITSDLSFSNLKVKNKFNWLPKNSIKNFNVDE
jgi:nucleoside-diphosphate-sugar epimerase